MEKSNIILKYYKKEVVPGRKGYLFIVIYRDVPDIWLLSGNPANF